MKVHIDESPQFECVGLLNYGERWNGFEQPIFNADQIVTVQEWWRTCNEDNEMLFLDEVATDLGNDEWTVFGWCWTLVEE